MKIIFTSLLSLVLLTSNAQTIPNGGFESWVTAAGTNPDLPAGWKSASIFPGIHKSTDAHGGNLALKMSVAQYFTGAGAGDINYGFTVPTTTVSPLFYTFWAKVHISGTDKFNVSADFTMPPSTFLVTEIPYGLNSLTSTNNTTVWKQFSFGLQGSGATPYDSIGLRFTFYPALDTSSYVIVDDLAFSAHPASVSDVNEELTMEQAYPNPASSLETIDYSIKESQHVTMDIFDVSGKRINTVINENQSSGRYKAEIDIRDYSNGLYYLVLQANGRTYTQKMAVSH